MSGEYGRRMDISVTVDIWRWPQATKINVIDITGSLINYRFQKTIKDMGGTCQISMIPQKNDKKSNMNIMDVIKPMDVIKIKEFGALKFIGYVQRISYSGSIGQDGKPNRNATLTCQQLSGIFSYTSIGLGLGISMGLPDDGLVSASIELAADIQKALDDRLLSFARILMGIFDSYSIYIKNIASRAAQLSGKPNNSLGLTAYWNEYFDSSVVMVAQTMPGIPKSLKLFDGTEQSITLMDIIEKIIERPFNEFWADNGPRNVTIEGIEYPLPEKLCMVFRPTPFNGSLRIGTDPRAFDNLPTVTVDKNHLVSFNLSRSMDEIFTVYTVRQPAFDFNETLRYLTGQFMVDNEKVGQYLMKLLSTDIFFTRRETKSGDTAESTKSQLLNVAKDTAKTLYNWFRNNDHFLSGAISMMVPSEAAKDPKIGQKIAVEGLAGNFYVEGIAHTWSYQGALKSDLTVTRGSNREAPMVLTDRIFNRNAIQ